jgi:hypothetical protein
LPSDVGESWLGQVVQNISLSECIAKVVDHASVPGGQTEVEAHAATAQIWATLAVAVALDNVADAIRDTRR